MDEGTRTSGPSIDDQARGPAEIREDIAQTREELGETVEALAAKTDVKGQAKAKVEDARERALAKLDAVKDKVGAAKADDARERALAKLDAVKDKVGATNVEDAKGRARATVAAARKRVASSKDRAASGPGAAPPNATQRLKRALAENPVAFAVIAALATGALLRSAIGRR